MGKDGIEVDPSKLDLIRNWKTPSCLAELRKILGLGNFFRKFTVGYSPLTACLTDLTAKTVQWRPSPWKEEHEVALTVLKERLTTTPVLRLPYFTKQFTLVSDASLVGAGAVLLQEERPIAYSSNKFNKAERNSRGK